MNFNHHIVKYLKESETPGLDEYEDWTDYLEDNEYNLSLEDVQSLANHFELNLDEPIEGALLRIRDSRKTAYLSMDGNDDLSVFAWDEESCASELNRMSDHEMFLWLGIKEDDLYMDGWECTIGDFKEYPRTVYHYTTEEKWEEIQESGGLRCGYGSGITNTCEHGVFTSMDPEEHAIGTYGNVCLEIDLRKLKEIHGTLSVSPEPDALTHNLVSVLFHKLELDSRNNLDSSFGMSPHTVIVSHSIPLSCISEFGN